MGRRKVRIQRLECAKARQDKYSKRKNGLMKKAEELAILCDIDLALLMFSPGGRPSLYVGQDRDISAVLERLSILSFEFREERRGYTMKLLKKMYPKDDLEVYPRLFSPDINGIDLLKMQKNQLLELEEKLAVKSKILRDWIDPQNVGDSAQLKLMEDYCVTTLARIKSKKIQLQELQKKYQESQAVEGLHTG